MFIDAEEVEENIWACGRLHDQYLDEDLDADELDEEYEQYTLDLGVHSSSYASAYFVDLRFPTYLIVIKSDLSFPNDDFHDVYYSNDEHKDDLTVNFIG